MVIQFERSVNQPRPSGWGTSS